MTSTLARCCEARRTGIADNTIVIRRITARITTAGQMPASRHSAARKNTNWEGGWRVPVFVRWPGKIKAGTVLNGIASHQDWFPALLAAAGEPDIRRSC